MVSGIVVHAHPICVLVMAHMHTAHSKNLNHTVAAAGFLRAPGHAAGVHGQSGADGKMDALIS